MTSSLNPNLTRNIKGLYLFNLDLIAYGFTVIQSEAFWLLFDLNCDFMGVAIRVRDSFYNIHNLNNEHGWLLHSSQRKCMVAV